MRILLLATLLGLLGTTASSAYCRALPDDAATNYVENQTALALCRQHELDERLRQQQPAQFDALIQQFQLDLRMERNFANGLDALPKF